VLRVVGPIWTEKAATAQRLRRRISVILAWCIAEGHRSDDPAAKDAVLAALPRANGPRNHHLALPHAEVADAVARVRQAPALPATRLTVEFVIVTACRSGEVRGARWAEIDLAAAIWTIPGERMKTGREHRVPLSTAAKAVLDQAAELSDGSGLVFPNRGRPLSGEALRRVARRLETTIHGLRSTFRDWCGESGVDRVVAEAALAHRIGSAAEQAYSRSDLLERRREVMEEWAEYLAPRPT